MLPAREVLVDDRAALVDGRSRLSHAQLADDVLGLRARVPFGGAVVVTARRGLPVAAALAALDGWAGRVELRGALDTGGSTAGAVVLSDDVAPAEVPASGGASPMPPPRRAPAATRWRLFTSGTTGEPKPVDHTLDSLARTVRPGSGTGPRRWGLLYEPTRTAGVQVLLQALRGGDTVLDATHLPGLPERLAWLAEHGVDALSATPTLWRQVLQTARPGSLSLTQVTLGGEIADQRLLDALRAAFPGARVTHVFAATETGAAFAVSDGREGFPLAYLEEPPRGVALQVRDGVLFVHAPGASTAQEDGFASTGDLVEVAGDRVRFLGRASGVVNVGGVTVAPEQVETVLREHPHVADALVLPRRNPFSGWILTARVVAAPDLDDAGRAALPGLLRTSVAERLPGAHVPARIEVVEELPLSTTGKAGRR